jgi:hypothetical protein
VSECGESGVSECGAAVFVFEEEAGERLLPRGPPAIADFVGPAQQWHVLSFRLPLCVYKSFKAANCNARKGD